MWWLAGVLAKNAVDRGLVVNSYITTSLYPCSGVVCHYLKYSNVVESFQQLRFVLLIIC